jgi:hypothetical protein
MTSDATFYLNVSKEPHKMPPGATYKVCQVNVAVGVQEYVVGFNIAVDNVVAMNISQSTAQLCYPKADCILCKGFSRNVEAQVASAHEIDDEVPARRSISVLE